MGKEFCIYGSFCILPEVCNKIGQLAKFLIYESSVFSIVQGEFNLAQTKKNVIFYLSIGRRLNRNFHLNISLRDWLGRIAAMFAQYLLAQQRLLIDLKECE